MKGLEELNDGVPRKIKIISNCHFSNENQSINNKNNYISGGIIEEV